MLDFYCVRFAIFLQSCPSSTRFGRRHGLRLLWSESQSSRQVRTNSLRLSFTRSNPLQDIFLYALIIPMCPFILQERSHVASNKVAFWTSILLAAYGGAFLVTAPLVGIISDRWRCRRVLLWIGMTILTGSTSMLYVARSLALLTVARASQGVSAAIIWVVGPAIVALKAGPSRVGQALGYICSALCLSLMLSPVLSGLAFDRAGYHAVYAMAFALIGCDVILRSLLIENDHACPILPSTVTDSTPNSPDDATSPTMLDKELMKHRDPEQGLLPLSPRPITLRHLLQSPQVWTCMFVNFVVNGVVVACDAILPRFVVHTFQWNASQIGLLFFALYGPNFVLGYPIGDISTPRSNQCGRADSDAGKLADKYGTRWLMAVGLLVACPAWLLARLIRPDRVALLVVVLLLAGCGSALTLTAVMIEFSRICGEEAFAKSYGLYNVSMSASLLVSALSFTLLFERAGWSMLTLIFSILCGVSVAPVLLFIRPHKST